MHLNLPFDGSKFSRIPTEFIYKSMKVIKYHIFTVNAKGINLKLKTKHIGLKQWDSQKLWESPMWKLLNRDILFHFHLMETFKTLWRWKCLTFCYVSVSFVLFLSPRFILSIAIKLFLKKYILCNHNLWDQARPPESQLCFLFLLSPVSSSRILSSQSWVSRIYRVFQWGGDSHISASEFVSPLYFYCL